MNGAQSLIQTLVDCGVDICITNPGTSEMHFVAALDTVPQMRPVLALFEGVVSGAADGYARMADRPASTLLHLGPGLTNALANVHNARKAHVPMVNIVGEHATYHKRYDAPLNSDVQGLAAPLSHWVCTTGRVSDLGRDGAEAVRAARTPPGQIATLILPADVSWSDGGKPAPALPVAAPSAVPAERIERIAAAVRDGQRVAILMNAGALAEPALLAAGRIAKAIGARLLADTFTGRLPRGAGRCAVERLPYFGEMALAELEKVDHLVLAGASPPASFFAYPDKPSFLVPDGCQLHTLARPEEDARQALDDLAEALGAGRAQPELQPLSRPDLPSGPIDAKHLGMVIGALLPEQAIVADEGNTEGFLAPFFSAGAPPHDWLSNCGGSIGMGLPLATGAALACPQRPVLCLEGDGSAMYTIQALWTQARENLHVVNLILVNRSYRILNIELARVGAGEAGERAKAMLDIGRPDLDFVALARGMGVPASRVDTAEDLARALEKALAEPGPSLIEAVMV